MEIDGYWGGIVYCRRRRWVGLAMRLIKFLLGCILFGGFFFIAYSIYLEANYEGEGADLMSDAVDTLSGIASSVTGAAGGAANAVSSNSVHDDIIAEEAAAVGDEYRGIVQYFMRREGMPAWCHDETVDWQMQHKCLLGYRENLKTALNYLVELMAETDAIAAERGVQ